MCTACILLVYSFVDGHCGVCPNDCDPMLTVVVDAAKVKMFTNT